MATRDVTIDDGRKDSGLLERDVGVGEDDRASNESLTGSAEDILALQDLDPALNAKMHLVNNVRFYLQVSTTALV